MPKKVTAISKAARQVPTVFLKIIFQRTVHVGTAGIVDVSRPITVPAAFDSNWWMQFMIDRTHPSVLGGRVQTIDIYSIFRYNSANL